MSRNQSHRQSSLVIYLLLLVCTSLTALLIDSAPVTAEPPTLVFYPVGSQTERSLHLVFPPKFRTVAARISGTIRNDFDHLSQLIGMERGFRTQVQLMEAEQFYRTMQVPRWTNAIYLRSKIIIPIRLDENISSEELARAIRHEMVHALIDHQSRGRCPGWLDEGLAQLLEGPEHPILRNALRNWVTKQGTIPLSTLQTGFTKLPREMVPAAYAQSLYATKLVLASDTPNAIRSLFQRMQNGEGFETAFRRTFDRSVKNFEDELQESLSELFAGEENETNRWIWQIGHESFLTHPQSTLSKRAQLNLSRPREREQRRSHQ